MRIKSYFAPSVQSAISLARREFGDDVTLVTSHAAALDSRHLGDYEVVFAVEEEESAQAPAVATQVIKAAAATAAAGTAVGKTAVLEAFEPPPAPEPVAFETFFQEAVATPLSTETNLPEKLEQVETLLLEMGIDGPMVRALMTMIERTASIPAPVRELAPVESAAAEPEPVAAMPAAPADLTPAELAFYLSVSGA